MYYAFFRHICVRNAICIFVINLEKHFQYIQCLCKYPSSYVFSKYLKIPSGSNKEIYLMV